MIYQHLFHLELLSVLELSKSLNLESIKTARKISATAVNISDRQRMLSQKTAFLSLRLVCVQDPLQQEKLRSELLEAAKCMEKAHLGLLNGDSSINLLSLPSEILLTMYFQPPLNLNQQVYNYLQEIRALAQTSQAELTLENRHLSNIIQAASGSLLEALEAVANQYEQESEAEQLEMTTKLIDLYEQSCVATVQAEAQTKKLEETLIELKKAQAKLLHQEKMSSLGQLVASVAHEINNPVSFIYGNLNHAEVYTQDLIHLISLYQEFYADPPLEIQERIADIELDFLMEDLPKVLCSMQIGADRIRQIVMSLRNFSRTDDSEMKQVDLHEGLNTTLLILQNRLKVQPNRPAIEVVKNYEDLPLVECYPGQLNQVFMNLLSNGIDALEEMLREPEKTGTHFLPKIQIFTEYVALERVRLRIVDNGSGMQPEVKDRVFEQFFTTKNTDKGTGLGLSISRQIIVENHSGSIGCESELGRGTEFWIEIPVKSPKQGSQRQSRPEERETLKMQH